jgi:ubiquinone/menaquinone biosynthesis C-methylase UbiE
LPDRYSLEQIQEFWKQQALRHGQSSSASWNDGHVIEMEIREILTFLNNGDRVLDIGCANGYSTVQFAAQKQLDILGIDYIPEMIDQASLRVTALRGALAGNVSFEVGNILELRQPTGTYDKVVVTRVVINLGDWVNQLRGLRECARVLKAGGLLLLSEATLQGWSRLNDFRREWNLPDIPIPPFNNYLDQERLIEELTDECELIEVLDFASSYYVGTRLLKPLLIQALGIDINVADPNLNWNRWFAQLPPAGDYGTQKLFVFKKR